MTVWAYLRVSSKQQDENNQLQGINLKAKQLALEIDRTIVDKVSGITNPKKRKLHILLKKAKKDDIVIVSELSRLGRSIYILFDVIDQLHKKGVKLYAVKENFSLDNTIQSKVILFAFGLSAEIERNLLVERTREALRYRKAQGIKLGRPVGSKSTVSKLDPYEHKIEYWYKKGVSQTKICKRVHCSAKTLRNWLKKHELFHEDPRVLKRIETLERKLLTENKNVDPSTEIGDPTNSQNQDNKKAPD